MRLTHIMEGNLLYSKSTDLNVNLIQKHLHRYIQKTLDQISRHPVAQPNWHMKLTITLYVRWNDFEMLPSGQTICLFVYLFIYWVSHLNFYLDISTWMSSRTWIMFKCELNISLALPIHSPSKTLHLFSYSHFR